MAIADLTDVQVQQAEEVGRCMRTHVDNVQKLAVQGLCTLFTTADGIFGRR